jgi:hypothetical protein
LSLRDICFAALATVVLAFIRTTGTVWAQTAPAESIPVHHEISGSRSAYQAGEDDTSDSLAARFGEPELTLFPDGGEPELDNTITIDNRHVATARLMKAL